jgi:hypothetical protein
MTPPAISDHPDFLRSYSVKILESYSLVHPAEQLYHFPARLEEVDRTGLYLRVEPQNRNAWIGFFVLGFDAPEAPSGVYSCAEPDWVCVVVGGYAYAVDTVNPRNWIQIEQRPVIDVRVVPDLKLLLFVGFTSITALGERQQLWTTERLSWEGISVSEIKESTLYGRGWDATTDKEIPFEVDLVTGRSRGGARPGGSGD